MLCLSINDLGKQGDNQFKSYLILHGRVLQEFSMLIFSKQHLKMLILSKQHLKMLA